MMKQMIVSVALIIGMLSVVPFASAAEDAYQWEGYIQEVDVRGKAIIMGGQRYSVARKVKIHGLGINPTLADLDPSTEIGFTVTYNPQTKRNDLITEIWLLEM